MSVFVRLLLPSADNNTVHTCSWAQCNLIISIVLPSSHIMVEHRRRMVQPVLIKKKAGQCTIWLSLYRICILLCVLSPAESWINHNTDTWQRKKTVPVTACVFVLLCSYYKLFLIFTSHTHTHTLSWRRLHHLSLSSVFVHVCYIPSSVASLLHH